MDRLFELDKSTVVSRLSRWGRWKMASGVALGFSSMSAFMRLGGGTNPGDRFGDIDVECIETNKAFENIPAVYQAVIGVEYLSPYKDSAVKAHKYGKDKRTYYRDLECAHEKVAEFLNKNLRECHKSDINMANCSLVRPQTA